MSFYDLVALMAVLRSLDGCPWDRARTIEDLRPYILEEAMELIDAIDLGDAEKIKEELGDLLFEIIFVSRICEEEGKFTIDDAIGGIADKMKERHPHVFGEKKLETPAEVEECWEEIKARKRQGDSILSGISEGLSSLVVAEKYGRRASEKGFDWDDVGGVLEKLEEEMGELKAAVEKKDMRDAEDEIGDLLFSVVNLSRFLGVHPELALRRTNRKFFRRFRYVEESVRKVRKRMNELSIDELEALWCEAKEKE
jgi:tetrapyrrole methylase family protein/MazG family protein